MKAALFLSGYIPSEASVYCYELWKKWGFDMHVARPRKSRLGDFKVIPGKNPAISVNIDLNPYSFLITYLHEVAHCVVFRTYRRGVAPHGKEWKQVFGHLLQPMLAQSIFPEKVQYALANYAVNPKASTGADPALFLALKDFDNGHSLSGDVHKILLHLNEGETFKFKNRLFLRAELRRTRILCIDKKTKRKYTLPSHALVEIC